MGHPDTVELGQSIFYAFGRLTQIGYGWAAYAMGVGSALSDGIAQPLAAMVLDPQEAKAG
jgi:hypothetical protein